MVTVTDIILASKAPKLYTIINQQTNTTPAIQTSSTSTPTKTITTTKNVQGSPSGGAAGITPQEVSFGEQLEIYEAWQQEPTSVKTLETKGTYDQTQEEYAAAQQAAVQVDQPQLQLPEFLTQSPYQTGFDLVGSFWGALLGTPEQKVEAITTVTGDITPFNLEATMEDVGQILETNLGKETYTGQNMLVNPLTGTATNIELPQLPDIGKWILIGGGVLIGVYLLGKVLGRKQ